MRSFNPNLYDPYYDQGWTVVKGMRPWKYDYPRPLYSLTICWIKTLMMVKRIWRASHAYIPTLKVTTQFRFEWVLEVKLQSPVITLNQIVELYHYITTQAVKRYYRPRTGKNQSFQTTFSQYTNQSIGCIKNF